MTRKNTTQTTETDAATQPAFEELFRQLEFHQRKAMEIVMQLNRTHTNGLFKRNGLTREQFRALLRSAPRSD